MDVMSASDLDRLAAMQRMKRLALGLLVFVTVVFLLARWQEEHHGWLGYVRAFSEAAMIGALADWFAVTALFRHPLGIPIPHTALIPKKKDVFAKSLEDFVVGHFLTGDAARERYLNSGASRRVGQWLEKPANSERLVAEIKDLRTTHLCISTHVASNEGKRARRMLERFVKDVVPLVEKAMGLPLDLIHKDREIGVPLAA